MKKGVHTYVALILIVMILIASVAAAFYWLSKVQSQMEAGTKEYGEELTGRISRQLDIVSFNYNPATYSVHVIMRNIGTADLEGIGSKKDKVVAISKIKTCSMPFNETTCDGCPFDLKVGRVNDFTLDFWGTDCQELEQGAQYEVYFSLGDANVRKYTTFIGGIAPAQWTGWTRRSPSTYPSNRTTHAMATIYGTDKVVLFGGLSTPATSNCDESGDGNCNGTWVYDYSDNSWSRMDTPGSGAANELYARYAPGMAGIYGTDKIVLFGGTASVGVNCDGSGSRTCNDTWIYDYSDDAWTLMNPANSPSLRNYISMATIYNTDKVLFFGGGSGAANCDDSGAGGWCNGTWIYDYSDNNWILMNTPVDLTFRSAYGIANIYETDQIVLFAGYSVASSCDGSGIYGCNGTWVYDYSNDTWTLRTTPVGLVTRNSHAMAAMEDVDKVLIFGGESQWIDPETENFNCDDTGGQFCNGTYVYDLNKDFWILMSTPIELSARRGSAMAVIDGENKIVLFGGDGEEEFIPTRYNDTWIFS